MCRFSKISHSDEEMLDEVIGEDVVETVEGKIISLVSLEDSLRFDLKIEVDELGFRLSNISFFAHIYFLMSCWVVVIVALCVIVRKST